MKKIMKELEPSVQNLEILSENKKTSISTLEHKNRGRYNVQTFTW
jgi:hypothetical protein